MGLVERLKAESRKQYEEALHRKNQEQARERALEESERRQYAEVLAAHNTEAVKAANYYRETGIDAELRRLASFVRGEVIYIRREPPIIYSCDGAYIPTAPSLPLPNLTAQLRWEITKTGEGTNDRESKINRSYEGWDIFTAKSLTTVVDPRGNLRVEGGWFGSSSAPLNKWRSNSALIDSAIEKAYRRPKRITFNGQPYTMWGPIYD